MCSFFLGKQKFYDNFFSRIEIFHELDLEETQYRASTMYPIMSRLRTKRTGINFGAFFPVFNNIAVGPMISLYHQQVRVSLDNKDSGISDTFKRNSMGGRGGFGVNWSYNNWLNLSLSSMVSNSQESNVDLSAIIFPTALFRAEEEMPIGEDMILTY